ncbi:MAG: hypothetical protein K2X77_00405 [Candidatus Obscuribacterales bacterium]|nr:hypothetical protein [Candidatus Obscuribacterales bacterium]
MADNQQPAEQTIEKNSDSSSEKTSEKTSNEANSGKEDLVQKQKDYIDYLKNGGTSGITDEFGKPMFKYSAEVVKAAVNHKPGADMAPSDSAASQQKADVGQNPADASKPTGDGAVDNKSDGSKTVTNSDGSTTYLNDDNSQMTVDRNGRVVALTQADGRSGKFEYNPNGDLEKIQLPDGGAQTKKSDGTWVTTDKNGKETGRVNGDIQVTKDGDVVFVGKDGNSQVSHLDGSKTIINADQSQLTKDKSGRVTSLTQADGDTAKFEYDKGGNLTKVHLPDGGSQTRQSDGSWSRTDKDGKEVGKLNGDIFVTQSGDVVFADHNGEVQVSHLDASRTFINKDQSQMTFDKNGKVTSLTQSDGDTAKFEYDKSGNLAKVQLPDGGSHTKQPDGTWTRTDKNGKVVGKLDGDISVTDSGDTIFADKNGDVQVSHLDSSRTFINKDQSQMTFDKDGKVTSLTQADGDTAKFEYDQKGQLNKIHLPDGGAQTRQADGTWTRTDKDGKEVGKLNGDISVTKEGDVVFVDKNGEAQISHLDGARTFINKDQSQITYDKDGRVRSLTQADGDTANFEYDKDGKLRKFSLPDGGAQTRNDDGTWTRTDKNGKEVAKVNGDITVENNGDLVLKKKDGSGQISHLDGSKTITNADKSDMKVDKDGKVVAITQADGDKATFEYDQKGQLNKIHLPDGGAQTKNADGTWTRTDKDGKELKTLEGDISVTPEGDVVLIAKDGHSQISHLDGSTTRIEPNQSQTTTNKDGQVVNIGYPDGTRNRVEYGVDSKPNTITTTTAGGDTYVWKKEGESWNRYDSSGKPIDKIDGDISVEPDGSIKVTNKDGSTSIQRPDGRQE